MIRIGVVTGLIAEADCLRRSQGLEQADIDLRFACSGGRPENAASAAMSLVGEGCQGLVSFGLAGGLMPGLKPGDLITASGVVDPCGQVYATDDQWRQRAVAAASPLPVAVVQVAGEDTVLATPADKFALQARTGAAAVDMESHAVARAADTADIPFLVLRAIADPASHGIPRVALSGLGADGRTHPLAVAARLATRPWQLPALIRLALESRAGFAALGRVAGVGPPLFRLT